MIVNKEFFDLLVELEGFKSCPYLDSVKIPTIGIGTIRYPDGRRVTMQDKCITLEEARKFAYNYVKNTEKFVNSLSLMVNQNQFNALVSFAYNVGDGALKTSTLLKKVKINPNDPSIRNEFLKWNKAGGKVVQGLTNRRIKESKLYFSK